MIFLYLLGDLKKNFLFSSDVDQYRYIDEMPLLITTEITLIMDSVSIIRISTDDKHAEFFPEVAEDIIRWKNNVEIIVEDHVKNEVSRMGLNSPSKIIVNSRSETKKKVRTSLDDNEESSETKSKKKVKANLLEYLEYQRIWIKREKISEAIPLSETKDVDRKRKISEAIPVVESKRKTTSEKALIDEIKVLNKQKKKLEKVNSFNGEREEISNQDKTITKKKSGDHFKVSLVNQENNE